MYRSQVPSYKYALPCGHLYKSFTESHADEVTGLHYFFCWSCNAQCTVSWDELDERIPVSETGRMLTDKKVARLYDQAILKDRIADYYNKAAKHGHGLAPSYEMVMVDLDVPERLVRMVAADLEVYRDADASLFSD